MKNTLIFYIYLFLGIYNLLCPDLYAAAELSREDRRRTDSFLLMRSKDKEQRFSDSFFHLKDAPPISFEEADREMSQEKFDRIVEILAEDDIHVGEVKIRGEDITYEFSNFFYIEGGRIAVIGFLTIKGFKYVRLYTISLSQGLFRTVGALYIGIKGIPLFSKCPSENALLLPVSIQKYLFYEMNRHGLAVRVSVSEEVLQVKHEEGWGIFVARINSVEEDQQIEDTRADVNIYFEAPEVIIIAPKAPHLHEGLTVHKPEDLIIKEGYEPNAEVFWEKLENNGRTYSTKHALAGKVSLVEVQSINGILVYNFYVTQPQEDGTRRFWLAALEKPGAHLNAFGVRKRSVDTRELTMPLWEYPHQVLPEFRGPYHEDDPTYLLAWSFISRIPAFAKLVKKN